MSFKIYQSYGGEDLLCLTKLYPMNRDSWVLPHTMFSCVPCMGSPNENSNCCCNNDYVVKIPFISTMNFLSITPPGTAIFQAGAIDALVTYKPYTILGENSDSNVCRCVWNNAILLESLPDGSTPTGTVGLIGQVGLHLVEDDTLQKPYIAVTIDYRKNTSTCPNAPYTRLTFTYYRGYRDTISGMGFVIYWDAVYNGPSPLVCGQNTFKINTDAIPARSSAFLRPPTLTVVGSPSPTNSNVSPFQCGHSWV